MLQGLIKSVIVLLILAYPFYGNAQTTELKKHLNNKEIKKLASSEKLIKKGDQIMDDVKDLQTEVDALKNADGRIKTRKINKLNQKIAETKQRAAIFFNDGYAKHINVLDKRIKTLKKQGNSNANNIAGEVKTLEKKAKKQYKKSERLNSPDDIIEMLNLAKENQNKAIQTQEKFLLSVYSSDFNKPQKEIEEATPVIADTQQSIDTVTTISEPEVASVTEDVGKPATTITENEAIVAPIAVAQVEQAVPEPAPVIEKKPVNKDVFLTIQFLADKVKASDAQLKSAYSGSMKIIEKQGSGWYRYSVGQFTNTTEAKETMQKEGIKGFIVAYNKDVRISVKEALDIINNQ
nr:hypothetical protein [uncultured Carboxylicivirga sp.]